MTNSELQNNHYKICTPEQTVKKIKAILSEHGIIVEEKCHYNSSITTSSLRLVIKGTDIGTNGKGINVTYAAASAYAEFIERLENQHLNSFAQLSGDKPNGFYLFSDEKIMHIDELLEQKDAFLSFYFTTTKVNREEFLKIHTYDYEKTNIKDAYISLPFWDYRENRSVYLPYNIYRPWYGSNGMCAGNSPAEALVQGMSELFERIVMKRIFVEKVALPNVPDEYIKRFPYIYERYQNIKKNDRYFVRMIDCSFGGKYPVVGLLLVEKNTGNYGLKLGCHPDFGIAMERTMTEASQGQDIFDFANSSFLDFANEEVFSELNVAHCFMTGEGQYPYQFFSSISKYSFFEPRDVSMKSNEELLCEMISKIQQDGYHVLIRNVSYMGFPAFHIIIPGLSETGVATKEDYEMIRRLNYAIEIFRNPRMVNSKNADEIMSILQHYSYQQYLSFFMHTEDVECIPWEDIGESVHFYQAALSMAQGNYADSIKYLTMISQKISMIQYPYKNTEWLLAVVYYLSAKQELDSHQDIMQYMSTFFDEGLCKQLDELFSVECQSSFNSDLFCKLVVEYKENEKDLFVTQTMNNNQKAMIGNMPKQCRVF